MKEFSKTPRISRSTADLVDSLRRHLKLLQNYYLRAFEQGDLDYLGEIAGKLRLLVYEGGQNTPLLLSIMDKFALDIPIVLDGPPVLSGGKVVSLREYLDRDAYGVRTPSSGFVMLTKKQLIRMWAVTNGASHEDWDLDEVFIIARDSGLFIGGVPAAAGVLGAITKAVLHVGTQCLAQINKKEG
jgi:hypothetical protein